jgi:hypothetical protein
MLFDRRHGYEIFCRRYFLVVAKNTIIVAHIGNIQLRKYLFLVRHDVYSLFLAKQFQQPFPLLNDHRQISSRELGKRKSEGAGARLIRRQEWIDFPGFGQVSQ